MADAYSSAMSAFANGKVIGDGFGPLVASELVKTVDANSTWTEPVKDTEVAKLNYQNHVAYVVKAKGPGRKRRQARSSHSETASGRYSA